MSTGDQRFPVEWSKDRSAGLSLSRVRLEHLRKLRGSEQVAAICYRLGKRGIEFLLVRTRGGRWTFPKGRVESGLTHAQAAALEAFEEAGVHGRIEETAFARYVHVKAPRNRPSDEIEVTISAHLCEVSRLVAPEEDDRDPTWHSAEKARRRLRDHRSSDYGDDLARIVDRAVARIQRLYREGHPQTISPRRAEVIEIGNARATANVIQAGVNVRKPRRGAS
jgi:8-oxo-dGTP pyrophosphatase MutT (NUDIX family)